MSSAAAAAYSLAMSNEAYADVQFVSANVAAGTQRNFST